MKNYQILIGSILISTSIIIAGWLISEAIQGVGSNISAAITLFH